MIASSADSVRAFIARRILGADVFVTRVGDFTLRPAQERTLVQVRGALSEFGGALLADPPGTGKTVIALAVATAFPFVLVVAPAALRPQWLAAAARAGTPIAFESFEALSRGATTASCSDSCRASTTSRIVIVDEAHHARNTSARRYAHLAAACVGTRVLLLSATPVVNRAADRDALLALFLGSRASRLTPAELGRCIVRRTDDDGSRPPVRRIAALLGDADVPGVAELLARLPPPLPASEGLAATALVVMSLAMAWHSSLAALDAALRRRVQRGEAFADLLRAGQRPSHAAVRGWVLCGGATQLAFPELVGDDAGLRDAGLQTMAAFDSEAAQRTLALHLDAVRALRTLVRPLIAVDTERRAQALRALARSHPCDRIVVFARHAETIRALHGALRAEPGVVALTGARVQSAAGRWTRGEVLSALGPRASPLRRDDPRAIRMLLATDVVAEGVEMQGVRMVVHADRPWTPARMEQRLGRVTRVGSAEREVLVTGFSAPEGARELVRLSARLARKAMARRLAVREGDARARIERILHLWRSATEIAPESAPVPAGTSIATVRSQVDGFVALLDDGEAELLCGVRRGARWKLTRSPSGIVRLLATATGPDVPVDPAAGRRAGRVIERALARRAVRSLSGRDERSSLGARIVARLDRCLAAMPALHRARAASGHRILLAALGDRLEAGLEARLGALLRRAPGDDEFVQLLEALLRDRTINASANNRARARVTALLLLTPDAPRWPATPAPSPPSASP